MQTKDGIFKLKGKVQHYAWGGFEYIPNLLNIDNPEHKPFAEYWMGAHPSASSQIELTGGQQASLQQIINNEPEKFIGKEVSDTFHELPYLFKILDVKDMLSIQVHPSRSEAIKGFEKEEAEGVPLSAANRNYKDKNHKPEVMVALSDFWLLHGFKNEEELLQTLKEVNEFNFLVPVFEQQGYYGLYKMVMEMPQSKVDDVLKPLVERLLQIKPDLQKSEPGYWAAKVFEDGRPVQNIDRGIFSIYFFNVVEVKPGEAVFQGAGVPHAYLFGQNVELMANSDNVLRGGLTPKHIDVPELLKHTLFEAVTPNILKGDVLETGERVYPCPVKDFGIAAIQLLPGRQYTGHSSSAEIFVVTEGDAFVEQADLTINRGEALMVIANVQYTLSTTAGCNIYKAFVPAT